jgi:hypothetical protein
MAGTGAGSVAPPSQNWMAEEIADLDRRLRELFAIASGGKAIAVAVQTGLGTLASSGTTWAGPVDSPSTVSAGSSVAAGTTVTAVTTVSGANGVFSAGISSVGAYNTDVSLLSGARQTVWQHNSGVYGFAPSSRETKTNVEPVPFTAADVLAVSPRIFQYKAQVAIREDPTNGQYNPDYSVPWEVGLMAEDLIAHNMSCFVFWNEDGTPRGINYDLFGAVAPLVVLAEFAKTIPTA